MKLYGKKIRRLLALGMIISLILAGCTGKENTAGSEAGTSEIEELQAQIEALQKENEQLKAQLEQYSSAESQQAEQTETAHTEMAQAETESEAATTEETASVQETQTEQAEEVAEDKLNIVVLGDSIWDMDRGDTGIAAQVANYMNADVYNCAIGGTRASLKEGESDVNYDSWDSTSLTGMCYVLADLVSPEFLEGYPGGGVIRNVNPETVDYYILAYGLNDYFSGAPIAVKDGDTYDAHGYAGALRNAIAILRQISPNAKIMLISPTYCQFYQDGYMYTDSNMKDYGNGTLTDYVNACQNVAETENTLYIDAYSTMGINIYTADEYLEDGVHLTVEGRALYAKAVASCLKYGKPGEVSGNSIYY